MLRIPATVLASLLLAVACAADAPPAPPPAPPPPAATAPSQAPGGGGPALEPLSSRSAPSTASRIVAPGASFALPAEWHSTPPRSSMRLAQAEIPGAGGPGELTVFYFGPGGGGGVDANLERWAGQVETEPGTTPRRETFDVGTFRVTWIEVAGTLKPSTMGTGPTEPQPGARLLGAVVEGPQGPWFFKATGPAATIDAARDAFLAMLRTIEPAS